MQLPRLRLPRLSFDWMPGLPGRRVVLYTLYTLVLFVVFLIANFPHDLIVQRALKTVDLRPFDLDLVTARFAWWRGYELRDVRLVRLGDDRTVPPLLESSSVYVRPGWGGLLRGQPDAIYINAAMYGGDVEGSMALGNGTNRATVRLHDVEIARYRGLNALLQDGQVQGRLSGMLTFEGRRGNPMDGQAAGELEIKNAHTTALKVNGITVPDLSFQAVTAKLSMNAGRIEVEEFRADGPELKANATGQVTLRKPWPQSTLNLKANVQQGPQATDSVKGWLSLIPKPKGGRPDAPMTISGTIAQPRVK